MRIWTWLCIIIMDIPYINTFFFSSSLLFWTAFKVFIRTEIADRFFLSQYHLLFAKCRQILRKQVWPNRKELQTEQTYKRKKEGNCRKDRTPIPYGTQFTDRPTLTTRLLFVTISMPPFLSDNYFLSNSLWNCILFSYKFKAFLTPFSLIVSFLLPRLKSGRCCCSNLL